MVKLVVVDRSAESRGKIVDQINSFLRTKLPELEFMPRISIKPLSPEELKFHGTPDICIVGSEMLLQELTSISGIKRLIPDTPVMARTTAPLSGISTIEQLARLGADDVIPDSISAAEFLRKIIILSRRRAKARSGKLVLVESGKGGLGVTSLVAGLGECLVEHGKKAALLDFDFETQDLSRFLQARPFVNENLHLILEQNRPVTQEFVEQCLVPVWGDVSSLCCMPPAAESEAIYDSQSSYARTILSVLEVLDGLFDCVLVDGGSVRGAVLKTLLRVADKAAFIINNDPSALYASVDKLSRMRTLLSAGADLVVVENASSRFGLADKLLREEFSRAARLDEGAWAAAAVPFNRTAGRWPGSGGTLYSHGGSVIKGALKGLAMQLELLGDERAEEPDLGRSEKSWIGSAVSKIAGNGERKPKLLALPEGGSGERHAAPAAPLLAAETQQNGPADSGEMADPDVSELISGARVSSGGWGAIN